MLLDAAWPLEALSQDATAAPSGLIVSPAVEQESIGGPANDQPSSAEPLAFSYLLPNVSSLDGFGPQQAAVIGTADGTGGAGYDLTQTLMAIIAYPASFSLEFPNAIPPGGDGLLTVTAYADLGGTGKYLTLEAEGMPLGDLFVQDGQSFVPVTTQLVLSRQQLAVLAADGVITFSFAPSSEVFSTKTNFVRMQLTYGGSGGGSADFYSFQLEAKESASLAIAGGGQLSLYDAAGNLLASAQTSPQDPDAVIADFLPQQAGTYYAAVAGDGQYTLLVNRNATLELDSHGSIDSAQQINSATAAGRQWVIGQLGEQSAEPATDFYVLSLSPRSVLNLHAFAPDYSGGPNQLQPVLRLYDSSGNLVAVSERGVLQYHVPSGSGGDYYLEVAAADGTSGAYVLGLKSQSHPAKPQKPAGQLAKANTAANDLISLTQPGRRLGQLR